MKKIVLLGTALAFAGLLMFSCNKNRFDTEALQNVSVEGSGHWKLPIGSVSTSLGKMLDQLDQNGLISYDGDNNAYFHYSFSKDDVIKGSSFLSLGNVNVNSNLGFNNFAYGLPGIEPIDTVYRFRQELKIKHDTVRVESFVVRSGTMQVGLETNLGHVTEIELISDDVVFPNGNSMHESFTGLNHVINLEGATFSMADQDSSVTIEYAIHYTLNAMDAPHYDIRTKLGLNQLKLKEISGYIDHLVYNFSFDEDFELPLNIDGQLSLIGAEIDIRGRNTFGALAPSLTIAEAQFRGQNVPPITLLDPTTITMHPSETYVSVMPEETLDITFNTKNNILHLAGNYDLNPDGAERLLTLTDDSEIGLSANVTIPMHFNIPGVSYYDTLDVDLSSISATELVTEIDLGVLFKSQMPFNLKASLYSFNSQTRQKTGTIMENLLIPRSSNGDPVQHNEVIALTQETMRGLMESDMIIMELNVDTDNQDVWINYANGLDMTIKADVIYGGTVDVNN